MLVFLAFFCLLPHVPIFHPTPAAEISSGGGEEDPVLERQAYLDGEDGARTC